MEVWPSDVGLRGQASNPPVLRWLKTVVVSDREKAHEMRQVGTRKTYQKMPGGGDPVGSRRGSVVKEQGGIETGDPESVSRMSLAGARVLARWCPACRRREPGLLLLHGT